MGEFTLAEMVAGAQVGDVVVRVEETSTGYLVLMETEGGEAIDAQEVTSLDVARGTFVRWGMTASDHELYSV